MPMLLTPKASDVAYSYYRVRCTAFTNPSRFRLYEIELYTGAGFTGTRLTTGTAIESSSNSGYTSANAFDANDTTQWVADAVGGGNVGEWAGIQLGAATAILSARVMVSDSNSQADTMVLEGSNNGSTYTEIDEITPGALTVKDYANFSF
jgi:hypothetical protein